MFDNHMRVLLFSLSMFIGCGKETHSIEVISDESPEKNKNVPKAVQKPINEAFLEIPPEGDAAINQIQERELLAKIWYYAAETQSNPSDANITALREASSKAIKVELNANKSPCLWLAYTYRLEQKTNEENKILKKCDLSVEAYNYFIDGPMPLEDIIHNFRATIESHQRTVILRKMRPDSCEFNGEKPLSAYSLTKEWECRVIDDKVQIYNRATKSWDGKVNDSIPHTYEQEYKIYRMLIDGYEDKYRLQSTGIPLWASSQISEGMTVADIGSGPGLFTFKMASLVGEKGKVYAIDINAGLLKYITHKKSQKKISNIETILVSPDNIGLPENSVDIAFLVQTYHALGDFHTPFGAYYKTKVHPWLQTIRKAVKPDGMVVIQDHSPSLDVLQQHLIRAGFNHKNSYIEYDQSEGINVIWSTDNFSWAEAPVGSKTNSPSQNYLSIYTIEK